MAYAFESAQSLEENTLRIVREECAQIRADLLAAEGEEANKLIHSARKAFKRLRALLRLVRLGIGEHTFRIEDDFLRLQGKRLSGPRDAYVVIRTWDRVAAGLGDPCPLIDAELPRLIRGVLVMRYLEAMEATLQDSAEPRRVAQETESLEERLSQWQWWPMGSQGLEEAVAKQYRRCRRRWKKERDTPGERNRHRWRRDAKYLMHHAQLLSVTMPGLSARLEEGLSELVDVLGEEHDLAVLSEVLTSEVSTIARTEDMAKIERLIRREQKRLRKEAMKVGGVMLRRRAGKLPGLLS